MPPLAPAPSTKAEGKYNCRFQNTLHSSYQLVPNRMALPLIASMLRFGILILLPLLSFLNSVLAGSDITIVEGEAGDGGGRRSTSGGVGSSRSTSGRGGGRFELHRAAGEGNLERVQSELAGLSEGRIRAVLFC